MLKKNVGSIDRTVRIVLGIAIIGTGFYMGSWWGGLGIIPLLTAAFSSCPLYTLLGMSTCPTKDTTPTQ